MFVYNLKFNRKTFVKIIFVIVAIAVTIYFSVSTYRIYKGSFKVRNEINDPDVINITANNYTNVLKIVHENIDSYIGKKIHFTGYVYRLSDFNENNFVLARDMIISSDMQTLVVGFLCDCKKKKIMNCENNSWVEITGEITKGNYHGEIPVIKIKDIKKIDKPNENIYVYPPNDNYIPTSNIY